MIFKIKLKFKKVRAVSPVIAAILLIGLAVLAGATVFGIVMDILNSNKTTKDDVIFSIDSFSIDEVNDKLFILLQITNRGVYPVTIQSIAFDEGSDGVLDSQIFDISSRNVKIKVDNSGGSIIDLINGDEIKIDQSKSRFFYIEATTNGDVRWITPKSWDLQVNFGQPINDVHNYKFDELVYN